MAYSTSMQKIYVNSSSTTAKGVSIDDLKRCFGVVIEQVSGTEKGASCDLGVIVAKKAGDTFTDVKGVQWRVKSRREINKFAKYKPIRYNTLQVLNNTQRAESATTDSGYKSTWGIKRKVSFNYDDFEVNGVIQSAPWAYDPPTGGITSPYRITDFVKGDTSAYGYSSKAVSPVKFVFPENNQINIPLNPDTAKEEDIEFRFLFNNALYSEGWLPEYSVSLNDLLYNPQNSEDKEEDYYPTVAMVCKVGNQKWYYTKSADSTIGAFMNSSTPMAQVFINGADIVSALGGSTTLACYEGTAVWKVVMMLTKNKYLGTEASHIIANGDKISRLEYDTHVDTYEMNPVLVSWEEQVSGYSVSLRLSKNTASDLRYSISQMTINVSRSGKTTYDDVMDFTVQVLYHCTGGIMSGYQPNENVITTGTITIPVSSSSKTQNYYSTDSLLSPVFVFSGQDGIPSNVKVAFIEVSITRKDTGTKLTAVLSIDCSSQSNYYDISRTVK